MKIHSILRKHYWWINIIFGVTFLVSIVLLVSRDMSPYWAIIALAPLSYFNIVNLNMVIAKKELFGAISFLAILLYGVLSWLRYQESGNIYEIFTLDTFLNFLFAMIFFSVLCFIVMVVLYNKKSKYERVWKSEDGFDAAFYVFRKLPNSTASKISLKELEEMFVSTTLLTNTKLEKVDLNIIMELKNSWMRKVGIKTTKADKI